ncbi:MAG TPA: pseudouridine-5'-phosphate glycosidase [Pyrinomonadaceae bacterium]|nr:pseudouridine-5'-phosphate glycosidase [Pyrinomonadaceae bacterium]
MNPNLLTYSTEVKAALANKKPIVALESTVTAHGLPRPQNLETALRLEQIVRDVGAVPATIAILNGQLHVGLNAGQISFIAGSDDIKKVSTRDLPLSVAQKWNGATTVASTSWVAHRAGIKVFATGGIGGVHRGTLTDISGDLPILATTPIVVVCSGAKIVLDLPATREWLETHGVPVIGYKCDSMPAFYSRTSELPIDGRADSPAEVVQIFLAQQALDIERALLVTVPVPEQFEVPASELDASLKSALHEAARNGVVGRDVTPFLLSRMVQSSGGATLIANLALLENNARVASQIAVALASAS